MQNSAKKNIEFWKENATPKIIDEINNLSPNQLEEQFNEEVSFGTAGIRGVLGAGPNRINIYTIIKYTYGFAMYLKEKFPNKKNLLVVIGTDNRWMREEFSKIASDVLSSFGISVKVSLIIPTPFVSFAIRQLKADGGIIITASHNPPKYNGYKVYNEKGSQLLPDDIKKLVEHASERSEFLTYSYKGNNALISNIQSEVFDDYFKNIMKIQFYPSSSKDIKVVFSPQHGTSAAFMPKLLSDANYEVIEVKEQMSHDPDFKGTPSPNPEDPAAYELGIEYAKRHKADIFITTDPDADRVGVAAIKDGDYKILTGNQLAPIMLSYIIKHTKNLKDKMVIMSFVTSHIGRLIANKNQIKFVEIATGFKWVSSMIDKYESDGFNFLFGYEESYGSLIDDNISRDKDSLQAGIMVAEIANELKRGGKTLWDALDDLYDEFGYFFEKTETIEFNGVNSTNERIQYMNDLRTNSQSLFDEKVIISDLCNGSEDIAPMDLIKFEFENGSWICVRPSGTEPKIKFYQVTVSENKNQLKKDKLVMEKRIKIMKEGK